VIKEVIYKTLLTSWIKLQMHMVIYKIFEAPYVLHSHSASARSSGSEQFWQRRPGISVLDSVICIYMGRGFTWVCTLTAEQQSME
jgi:hypothetical protein